MLDVYFVDSGIPEKDTLNFKIITHKLIAYFVGKWRKRGLNYNHRVV